MPSQGGVKAAIVILLAIAFVLISAHFIAKAQSPEPCAKYDAIIKHLETKYSERRVATGATGSGNMMVVTASEKGSWTMIIVQANGTACMYASGEGWQVEKTGAPS